MPKCEQIHYIKLKAKNPKPQLNKYYFANCALLNVMSQQHFSLGLYLKSQRSHFLLIFPPPWTNDMACTQSSAGFEYTFIHSRNLESYKIVVTCWLKFISSQLVFVTPNYFCCNQTMTPWLWDEMSFRICFTYIISQLIELL